MGAEEANLLEELAAVAEEAVQAREMAMQLARANVSSMGKAFSKSIKEQGKTFAELLERYLEKTAGKGATFDSLNEEQRHDVYMQIINASGRSNQWVTNLSKNLNRAGRVMLVVGLATAAVQIASHEHPEVAGALMAAECFGVAVIGVGVDGMIGCGAVAFGLAGLPVLGLCLVAKVCIATKIHGCRQSLYDIFTSQAFLEHRRQTRNFVSNGNYVEVVQHNPKGLMGGGIGGVFAKAAMGGGPLMMVGGVACGALAGHYLDVKEATAEELRDENRRLRARHVAEQGRRENCEAELRRLRAELAGLGRGEGRGPAPN